MVVSKKKRAHNRFKREIRAFTFKQYDGILKMCKSTAKEWETRRLPLKTVNQFVDLARLVSEEVDPVIQSKVESFNKTLDIFKNVLRIRSKETMNDGKISINEIEHFVAEFKKSFIEGQNQDYVKPKED